MDEFDLINSYFRPLSAAAKGVLLGIGDDAAIVRPSAHEDLVFTTDSHVANRHFPDDGDPFFIGIRSVETSVSDLAAMGASPRWASLALTLPDADPDWLAKFTSGVQSSLIRCDIVLIGGDTTRGPLTVTWHMSGAVPKGSALRRSGARAGDDIYVSGFLGDAAAGLEILNQPSSSHSTHKYLLDRYWQPTARIALGQALLKYATSCIDISDGFLADISHIATQSECGAEISLQAIPLSESLVAYTDIERGRDFALCGGDDYELCFTINPADRAALRASLEGSDVAITRIGEMTSSSDVRIVDERGVEVIPANSGFVHFGR